MTAFQFSVVVGLLVANLVAVLLVQRMLQKHHDQATAHGADEGDEPVDDG